jgi:hypothetical protein
VSDFLLEGPTRRPLRRRIPRDPKPRFLHDVSPQLDPVAGCPSLTVPKEDVAWRIRECAQRFDYSAVELHRSALGRHGHNPRHVLAVWIYASIRGVHHSTKVEAATATDAVYRLLSGGRKISSSVLRKFRQQNAAFFRNCIEEVLRWAVAEGLIRSEELATDSMRLRAHASKKAVRTVDRSSARLEELTATDVSALSAEARIKHAEKLRKHQDALAACAEAGRRSVVLTNPSAALMKFPDGASGPGHRVTATAAGVSERIIIDVLIDASPSDYGKLPDAIRAARDVLVRCGLPNDARLQVAADPGYYSRDDLAFAAENRTWVDVLIPCKAQANSSDRPRGVFGRDRFTVNDDGSAICPAGTLMKGPWKQSTGQLQYRGVGCQTCALRPQCTKARSPRALYIDPHLDRLHQSMDERMAQPDAAKRYGQRMATVEPVFSSLEDTMGFRRSSTRHSEAVVAEVLLKVLAHNVSRLLARRPLFVVTIACYF